MSWNRRLKHPSEVLKKGDAVQARVISVDGENQRLSLSIKEFLPNEWDNFAKSHNVGDELIGTIAKITDFGLFIRVADGVEGLAHISEISRDPKGEARQDVPRRRSRPHAHHQDRLDRQEDRTVDARRRAADRGRDRAARAIGAGGRGASGRIGSRGGIGSCSRGDRRRKADRMSELDPVPAPGEAIADPVAVPTPPRKSRAGVFFLGAFSGCLVVVHRHGASRRHDRDDRRTTTPPRAATSSATRSPSFRSTARSSDRATPSTRCIATRRTPASKRSSCASTAPAERSRRRRRFTKRSATSARAAASRSSPRSTASRHRAATTSPRLVTASSRIRARSPARSA